MHPAKAMTFDTLFGGLQAACAAGMAIRKDCPATGRAIYTYSQRCVYDKAWDDFTLLARGLIIDPQARRVVATPFPKFFNHGEQGDYLPDLPFEVFEKLDGSLAIIHYHGDRWRVATKGAFESEQAKWSEAMLAKTDLEALVPGWTYLAEAVYPENRIVVKYDAPALVMLAAYREDGSELPYGDVQSTCDRIGWRAARRFPFDSFADLVTHAARLPATEEGFVIRFANGHRLKLKGDEYRRIHAMISRCTPLALWELMANGGDVMSHRRDLPEEFWQDFDTIYKLLCADLGRLKWLVSETAASVASLSDKEVGLRVDTLPPEVRPFIFAWRKSGGKLEGKALQSLYRAIRPTGNRLSGYEPSSSMNRVHEEAA